MITRGPIVVLAGLAAVTDIFGYSVVRVPGYNIAERADAFSNLDIRAPPVCNDTLKVCGSNCIPTTSECCSNDSSCEAGTYCIKGGCCKIGEICNCDAGQKFCGKKCISADSNCCDPATEESCSSGYKCVNGGGCQLPSGSNTPVGAIVGVVAGGVAIIIITVVVILLMSRNRRIKRKVQESSSRLSATPKDILH